MRFLLFSCFCSHQRRWWFSSEPYSQSFAVSANTCKQTVKCKQTAETVSENVNKQYWCKIGIPSELHVNSSPTLALLKKKTITTNYKERRRKFPAIRCILLPLPTAGVVYLLLQHFCQLTIDTVLQKGKVVAVAKLIVILMSLPPVLRKNISSLRVTFPNSN